MSENAETDNTEFGDSGLKKSSLGNSGLESSGLKSSGLGNPGLESGLSSGLKEGDIPPERRTQSHKDIKLLVESRTNTLALLGNLAGKQPFKPEHDTQALLQHFCESVIDYTATAHFQLYRHIDEDKEQREPVQKIAGEIYPRVSETTQSILDFNDRYDCEDHCDKLDTLAEDLSKLAEQIADRIELEDRLIHVLLEPRK